MFPTKYLHANFVRYGSEEGFGRKNEVRNERWIKKHSRRPLGGNFREGQGLTRNPNAGYSPLASLPDWSYADGRPGIPT